METDMREWSRMNDQMRTAVLDELGSVKYERARVYYSAYPVTDNGVPINNLNDVAVEGKCVFVQEYESFWDNIDRGPAGTDYVSMVKENPTWLEVAVMADDMMGVTGDHHHQFLESIRQIDSVDGVKTMTFFMGS